MSWPPPLFVMLFGILVFPCSLPMLGSTLVEGHVSSTYYVLHWGSIQRLWNIMHILLFNVWVKPINGLCHVPSCWFLLLPCFFMSQKVHTFKAYLSNDTIQQNNVLLHQQHEKKECWTKCCCNQRVILFLPNLMLT
jgi:hypothetical protein